MWRTISGVAQSTNNISRDIKAVDQLCLRAKKSARPGQATVLSTAAPQGPSRPFSVVHVKWEWLAISQTSL